MKTTQEQIEELSAKVAQLESAAGIASECRSRLADRISKSEARLETHSECMGGLAKRIAELEGVTGSALTGRLGRFESSVSSLSARIAKLEGGKAEVQEAVPSEQDTALNERLLKAFDADNFRDAVERVLDVIVELGRLKAQLASNNEAHEQFARDVRTALGPHMNFSRGKIKSVADLVTEHARLKTVNADLTARLDATEDRLAKVEPTDEDLTKLFADVKHLTFGNRMLDADPGRVAHHAACRALYNLGREHGNQGRAALLARAEKAEREKARVATTNPFTAERFKQLALLNAGWEHDGLKRLWRHPRGYDVLYNAGAAFDCLLFDRAQTPPRDTLTNPRPGDHNL